MSIFLYGYFFEFALIKYWSFDTIKTYDLGRRRKEHHCRNTSKNPGTYLIVRFPRALPIFCKLTVLLLSRSEPLIERGMFEVRQFYCLYYWDFIIPIAKRPNLYFASVEQIAPLFPYTFLLGTASRIDLFKPFPFSLLQLDIPRIVFCLLIRW